MKRKTIMMLIISVLSLPVIFVVVILALVYFYQPSETSFTLEEEVVRIPVEFNVQRGMYFSYIVVNNDTVRALIDTGFTISTFSTAPIRGNYQKRTATDAHGNVRHKALNRVNRIRWGGLKVNNLLVIDSSQGWLDDHGFSNVIGNDILRNFIVQFDNENREIVLTANPALIEKRGIAVPINPISTRDWCCDFCRENTTPHMNFVLNGVEAEFLLDTGYGGEIAVDTTFFHSSGLSELKRRQWLGGGGRAVFSSDYCRENSIGYRLIADAVLGERMFRNVLVFHTENLRGKYIGATFFRRFRTVTMDNINNKIYFELPIDHHLQISEDVSFAFSVFSDEEVTSPPIEHVFTLFHVYNSFGFLHSWVPPFTILALETGSEMAHLALGDTLVGINQTLFSQQAFDKITPQEKYQLINDRAAQQEILLFTMGRATEATFHFLSNGELISINAERKRFLDPVPYITYAFDAQEHDLHYFGLNFRGNPDASKMSFHLPWASLSGREFEFSGFNDEGDFILSNRVTE